MSKFGSNSELYARLGATLEKIKSDSVTVEDFENLLIDTRELYERALVLRFKAFEKFRNGEDVQIHASIANFSDTKDGVDNRDLKGTDLIPETIVPSDVEQLIVEVEEPGFEFALFGETDVEPESIEVVIEPEVQIEETKKEPSSDNNFEISSTQIEVKSTIDEQDNQVVEINTTVVEVKSEEVKSNAVGGSLLERLASSSQSSRLADQLKKSRIESIPASLTLNDRIRYAKNLFGGNSEVFNASIQLLDSQKSLLDAMELMRQYSERFNWNQDDKNTIDFYELLERRYA